MNQMQPTLTPQPGAEKNPLLMLSLPPNQDVSVPGDPSFPILQAKEAVNFGPGVAPISIDFNNGVATFRVWNTQTVLPYTGLYRVWGDPAWDVGGYWSVAAPTDEAAFYGSNAVEYSWNSARYFTQFMNAGALSSLKAWIGPVSARPAEGIGGGGGAGGNPLMPNYYLRGGGTQVFIPQGTLPWFKNQATPWSSKQAAKPSAALAAAVTPLAATALPQQVASADYLKLANALNQLTQLLRSLDARLNVSDARGAILQGTLTRQAEILEGRLSSLDANLPRAASDPDALLRAKLVLWSLVATGRLVDAPLDAADQSAVDLAVSAIVSAAHKMYGDLN